MNIPYYSVTYDETNNKLVKELQVLLRYWSTKLDCPGVSHLQTFFIKEATSDILKDQIISAMNNMNLQLKFLITMSSDGPNVNKSVFAKINENMKQFDRRVY